MKILHKLSPLLILVLALTACNTPNNKTQNFTSKFPPNSEGKIRIILDTDANNELDDQHAIAYMLFNQDLFQVEGITVNATHSGGGIESHMAEAKRVVELCGYADSFPILAGAERDYEEISREMSDREFEGHLAVDFIIQQARKSKHKPLTFVPIGSLTNIALALDKAPDIAENIKIVWLGSNWPNPGEYNLDNDISAVNPIMNFPDLDLEIVTVRYGRSSGTAAVTASVSEIRETMAGLGPQVPPVYGRHGGEFTCFGDYSVDLFTNIGDEERALFDVCALAILKNPAWAQPLEIESPILKNNAWEPRPNNKEITIFWEKFEKEAILEDFYNSMRKVTPASL